MHAALVRPIGDSEIATYKRDGIVCLRGYFDDEWVAYLRDLVETDIRRPSGMVKDINQEGASGFFFGDTFVRQNVDGFDRFVFGSPAAEMAATVMGSSKANLIFDQILVKEPGTSTPTLWHHDAPYWPVAGDMIATLWLALDPVSLETGAVEYVKGSHLWGERYGAVSFSPHETYKEDLTPVPDISANREKYDFARFEMEPGDCTLHHGLTVHGAPGNQSSTARRRAYITRWGGDDATYNPRPNLQRMLRDPGIQPGAPLDCDLFPVVWRASPA